MSNGDTQEASCLQEVTEQALRESEALRAISEDLLAPTELKAVLSAVLDRVTQLFTPDRAGIALRNLAANQPEQRAWESFEARPKEGGQSSWSLWRGFSKELLAGLGRQPMLPQELPRWLTLRHAIVYEDLQAASTLPEIIRAPLLKEGLLALLAIPLVHSRGLSGFLVLGYDQTHHFREREIIFAEAIGRQIAVVAENARLYEQTRELAAAEERARLARELHDSVSQSLFSLTLAVQTARDHLIAHPALAEQALALADDLARGALAEMRTLLFELRSTALQDEGLAAALEKHAAVVQHRAGLEVQVQVEDQRRLPADQEEALYRIAQEALANTVKHAHASHATLRLCLEDAGAVLEVRDNGHGFAWQEVASDSYGLRMMRERAEQVGGTLEIDTQPGTGTCIRARLPARRSAP